MKDFLARSGWGGAKVSPLPGDASVEGDARDVRTLLSWLDRAQRHQP